MAEKVSVGIFVVWMVVLFVAFLPLIFIFSVISHDAARHFFAGMLAGAAVYLAFFA